LLEELLYNVAHAMNDVFEDNLSANIFTKQDGQFLTLEIENKLSKLETRLVLWFFGLLLMQNALVFGLFKLVH
jgi:hypothetical protein